MKRINICGVLATAVIANLSTLGNAQTFSTPAYSGTGAASNTYTNSQTSTNFNSDLGQNLETSLAQNAGTAITPGNPAIGQPSTALGQPTTVLGQQGVTTPGQQGSTALGQQNTTALGQQGLGTAIIPEGTNAATAPSGTTTAVTPSGTVPGGAQENTNAGVGTITNGFIVNSDGSVTALPGAGSTAAANLGGTNTGTSGSIQTPTETNTLQNRTNTFQNP